MFVNVLKMRLSSVMKRDREWKYSLINSCNFSFVGADAKMPVFVMVLRC